MLKILPHFIRRTTTLQSSQKIQNALHLSPYLSLFLLTLALVSVQGSMTSFLLPKSQSHSLIRGLTPSSGFPHLPQGSHTLLSVPTTSSGFPQLSQGSHNLFRVPTPSLGFPHPPQGSHTLPRVSSSLGFPH